MLNTSFWRQLKIYVNKNALVKIYDICVCENK